MGAPQLGYEKDEEAPGYSNNYELQKFLFRGAHPPTRRRRCGVWLPRSGRGLRSSRSDEKGKVVHWDPEAMKLEWTSPMIFRPVLPPLMFDHGPRPISAACPGVGVPLTEPWPPGCNHRCQRRGRGDTPLIRGQGKLVVGQGPVRTGVTVIFPRGRADAEPVYAGWFSQNGNGEMTGTTWVEESGFLEGPVAITNTHSVGLVRDSVIAWSVQSGRLAPAASAGFPWSLKHGTAI